MKRDSKKPNHAQQIAVRLPADMFSRFERVVEASKRSKTSVVEECMEKILPELEKRYEVAKAA
jgi:predicted DNA-binding protein